MSLAILFHFLCAQHVSGIDIPIIRSLRLFCWITKLVVLFLVRCVLEFRCCCVGVVSVLQAASACNTDTTPNQPHRNSNTHRTKNNTTNMVIQQNSRKILMMDIFMSETCWAHKKWNKIASVIKFVFYSSTRNSDVHRAVHSNIISIGNQPDAPMYQIYFIFGMTLYMFRTVFPSIISSLWLYIQQYLFDICLLQYVQAWTPDNGRKDRPKHVECHSKNKINLIHWCIWLVLL